MVLMSQDDDEEKICSEIHVPTNSIQPGSRNDFQLGDLASGQYRVRAELVFENKWIVATSSSVLFEIISESALQVLSRSKVKHLSWKNLESRLNRLQRLDLSSSCQRCENDGTRKLVTCYDPVNYAIHGFGARFQSHAASLALALLTNRTLFTAPLRMSSSSSSFQGWIDLFESRNGCCDEDTVTTISCRSSNSTNRWMSLDAISQQNEIAYTGFYHPRALIRSSVKSLEKSNKDMRLESRASWFGRVQRWLWQPVSSNI